MNSMVVANSNNDSLEKDVLLIERLALALEKAASVDEIKDVRDRAMAVQLYVRKKAGGLAAAQAAGRVVTESTLMLAKLYHEEKTTRGANLIGSVRDEVGRVIPDPNSSSDLGFPGKEALARAADLCPTALRKLRPLVEASHDVVKAAISELEANGEIATPGALLRHITASSAAADYDGDEWYTPAPVIDLVRQVLGAIDVDPASNPHAQKTVKAGRFFTQEDDGLLKSWDGKVFCNPPYSMPLIAQFTSKLIGEFEAGRTTEAIYLVNNCTDSAWFHSLLSRFVTCFTRGRIGFENKKGQKFATRQGQAIFYLGKNGKSFREVFSSLGCVVST